MQIEEICVLLQNQLIFRPVQHLILNDRLNLKQRARNRPRTLVDSKFWATPSISILKPTFCQIWAIESGNGLYNFKYVPFLFTSAPTVILVIPVNSPFASLSPAGLPQFCFRLTLKFSKKIVRPMTKVPTMSFYPDFI